MKTYIVNQSGQSHVIRANHYRIGEGFVEFLDEDRMSVALFSLSALSIVQQ